MAKNTPKRKPVEVIPSTKKPRSTRKAAEKAKEKMTLLDLADLMDDKTEPATLIYVEPPPPDYNTDEDDANDDDGGFIDNLTPRMLDSNGNVAFCDGLVIGESDNESDDETVIVGEFDGDTSDTDLTQLKRVFTDWQPVDLDTSSVPTEDGIQFPQDHIEDLDIATMTPVSIFELFFDESIFLYLQKQMSVYAKQQNRSYPDFTINELKTAFGILIASGLAPTSNRRDYWSTEKLLNNPLISKCMKRDRFDSDLQTTIAN